MSTRRSPTVRLLATQACLDTFHCHKAIFIKYGVREHFNIPKLHALTHYVNMIQYLGTPDGYNTKAPERLRIDFAKAAYRASNCLDHVEQMAVWLQRRESLWVREGYVDWIGGKRISRGIEEDLAPLNKEDRELASVIGNMPPPVEDGAPVEPDLALPQYRIAKNPSKYQCSCRETC